MFVERIEDLIALLQIQALDRGHQTFGSIARERDLVGRGAHELRGLDADCLLALLQHIAVLVWIDRHEAPVFDHGIVDRLGSRSERPGVEVGEALRHHELRPDARPVAAVEAPVLARRSHFLYGLRES